ncbi:pitrilysin family protein [Bacteroides sp. 224]|uniref:M16 family metallopeptidase n=1 Tax=Bacteroides sp. 224 TaxID=2302936 RepID=UPI0013D46EFC|nr:M16 family metallopeptidase [Bacteroides sp. 224]NDV64935.1 insulinase family protein [Bacteroides sp. 224]
MKQFFKTLLVAALIIGGNYTLVSAQPSQSSVPPIPVDPNVRIGKLSNGLTYYIRKNNLPENRVDFYIAQKVGSIQETPEQRGLAHFLEHICFNGTTHFPGDALKQYLESIGVKFGTNLNAYTAIDETVYNISNVPAIREGIIDSCLLILHDWSNDLLLDPKEIDKERGVIQEEWRTRMSATQRLQDKALPQMFAGTKYADCLPIGSMDVVTKFPYQTLRDYYEKWYRPDLQGVVVVGDIDVDVIENKIKSLFSDIPAQPNAAERIYYPVDDNKEPIIVIEQDKEQVNTQILLFNKHNATPDSQKSSMDYLAENYAKSLISNMLCARLNELRQTATPPFIYAGAYDGNFFVTKTKGAFTGYVVCKEGEIESGLSSILREIERARRFGFTNSEYTRARADYLRQLESAYNERDKRKNDNYVNQYVRHFLDNEPIPGIEDLYTIMNQVAPSIPVEALNKFLPALVTGTNQVVAIFGPEKEGMVYPEKDAIRKILDDIKTEELTAYEDKVSDEPLIAQLPTPGKIVSEKQNDIFGTTSYVLSNGVKVYIKPTEFKADDIRMKGISFGGSSLFPNEDIINIMTLNSVVGVGGMAKFSPTELEKMLAGKKAWASSSVGGATESISGGCSPKDFETMMQITYLAFTAPRKDEEAFLSYKNRTKAALHNQELEPMVALSDTINAAVYMNHPRAKRLKADMIDLIDYDKAIDMYMDRFKDASDFTFFFVGNINADEVKPLIEQYLGALPSINRKETFKDNKMNIRKGFYKNEFIKQQETAKATNLVLYHGNCAYTMKNKILMSMLDQIMSLVYTETVREEEGGTYGVSVEGGLSKFPREVFTFQVSFDTDPAKKDKLMEIVFAELDKLIKNGPSESNLNKVKEYTLKSFNEAVKENGYWMGVLEEYILTGVNKNEDFSNLVNSITVQDIRKFAHSLFKQKNQIEVTMISPEKQ